MTLLKKLYKEEDGLGTVELIILIAVLVAIGLIFGKSIKKFVSEVSSSVLDGPASDAGSAVNEILGD